MRSFGLRNVCRRSAANFAKCAPPLTKKLKKKESLQIMFDKDKMIELKDFKAKITLSPVMPLSYSNGIQPSLLSHATRKRNESYYKNKEKFQFPLTNERGHSMTQNDVMIQPTKNLWQ